jgi:cytoskeletal protein CcmA (bactofilin family)
MRGRGPFCSLVLLASLSFPALGQGQQAPAGEEPTNVYMTGTEVRPTGPIHGDLVAAAGRISVDYAIDGDAVLAAGSIDVRGQVGEDLRVAGGFVTLTGRVRGEVLMVAASLAFGPDAEVGGRAWLAGGDVAVAGRFHHDVKVYARNILVLGHVTGNVHLFGATIEVLPSARIDGNLTYVSNTPIKIHQGARVAGKVIREPGGLPTLRMPGWPPFRPLLMFGLLAAGALLLALFPRFTASAVETVRTSPVGSLGLGTAIFFSLPPVILLLVITIIGIPIALMLAGLYAVALLAGFLVAAFFIGERLLQLARRQASASGYWARVAMLAVALIVLWLVRHLPYVGGLLILGALTVGLGAMALQAFSRYSTRT